MNLKLQTLNFRLPSVLCLLVAACQSVLAAPSVFESYNCSIEFPPNWRVLDPTPPHTVAVAQTPDGSRTLMLIAEKLPAAERANGLRDMIAGAKQSAIDKGWQISDERDTSVSGLPFHAFTTRVTGIASMVTFIGTSGDVGYVLQGICKASDAASDAELKAAMNSFHLLSALNVPAETDRPNSVAYRIGYIFGQALIMVVIGTVVVRLIRKARNK